MELNPVATNTTSAVERSRTSLAEDFDNFLTLLTAQLTNQDPLDPLDSNEFVAQLVSFTGVEQAINSNANLETLIELMRSGQSVAAVGYLGTTIEAEGDIALLRDGEASYVYSLPRDVAATGLVIINDRGEAVYSGTGETAAGEHTFVWNGRNNNGSPQPEGEYKIRVTARDGQDADVPVTTTISGRVTGVETQGGEFLLIVGGVAVPLERVISVTEGGAPRPPS